MERLSKAVPKMVPAQCKTPVLQGFHQLTDWKVVPGGGIDAPTRGFSVHSLGPSDNALQA